MYWKNKKSGNFRGKRGKKRMSATKKAYLAGFRRGKSLARGRRYHKRRY